MAPAQQQRSLSSLLLLPLLLLLLQLHSASCRENNASSEAGTSGQPSSQLQLLGTLQYYLWGWAGTTLSVLGIAGNSLSIRVLLSPRMASSTSIYLVTLAALDIAVLLLFDACMGLPLISGEFARLMQPDSLPIKILYPVSLFIHMCSMYVTTCFTVERYLSVKFPLESSTWCTKRRAKRLVLAICAFALAYNVPRAFEKIQFASAAGNSTADAWTLQEDRWYSRIYNGFLYSVFMYVLPLMVLAVSNALLVHAVRASTRRAQGSAGGRHEHQKRQLRDRSISLMLASVVVVFVFCQTFALVDNLIAVALQTPPNPPSAGQQAFYLVAQFMVVINSSVNFLLYCFFGLKFRRELRGVFCRRSGLLLGASNFNTNNYNDNTSDNNNGDENHGPSSRNEHSDNQNQCGRTSHRGSACRGGRKAMDDLDELDELHSIRMSDLSRHRRRRRGARAAPDSSPQAAAAGAADGEGSRRERLRLLRLASAALA